MRNFYDFTLRELETAIGTMGKEKFRARQLYQWIYNKGVLDFDEMTNISKGLRTVFKSMFSADLLDIREARQSQDGSIKFGFSATDGKVIESVFIPETERNTLCVSTQIGCRMGCRFCVTGRIGLIRNLTAPEIVGQIMGVKHRLKDQKITNIVFMGMGEPMDNLEAVLRAMDIIKEPLGMDFSHRRITVSSVGLIEGLKLLPPKLAGIAISLNAADDEKRTYLMPINRLYPIREIIDFIRSFKGSKRTRITLEYVLIKGINDSLDDAKRLADLLAHVKCKINLICYNESPYAEFKSPDRKSVDEFHAYLIQRHLTAIIRDSRGGDIGGGCGQLGIKYLEERRNGKITNV